MLTGERRVLVLQVEALRAEAQRAETDLQCQYRRHQAELQQLREESLQVRRAASDIEAKCVRLSHIQWEPIISLTDQCLFLFIMAPPVHGHDPTEAAA